MYCVNVVYICVHVSAFCFQVHVYVCVWKCNYPHVWRSQRRENTLECESLPSILLKARPFLLTEVPAKRAGLLVLGNILPLLPHAHTWVIDMCYCLRFMWVLGIQAQLFTLYPLNHLPSPLSLLSKPESRVPIWIYKSKATCIFSLSFILFSMLGTLVFCLCIFCSFPGPPYPVVCLKRLLWTFKIQSIWGCPAYAPNHNSIYTLYQNIKLIATWTCHNFKHYFKTFIFCNLHFTPE